MFRFNFDVEDGDETDFASGSVSSILFMGDVSQPEPSASEDTTDGLMECVEHSVVHLLAALPPVISFSPLTVPLSSSSHSQQHLTLARRDLFDARFQLISLEYPDGPGAPGDVDVAAHSEKDLEFLDAPSDLVPGVYEGGLKTWECASDLADCLDGILGSETGQALRGKRILELGCGTAIPSLYVLHRLFSADPPPEDSRHRQEVHVHLQDYNALVLKLVTLPNIILAWYMSPASLLFRISAPATSDDADTDSLPPADSTVPGTLPITPALTVAFLSSLYTCGVCLRFFSGSWESLHPARISPGRVYNIVLTSETIYRPDSLPALVRVMREACLGHHDGLVLSASDAESEAKGIEKAAACLSLDSETERNKVKGADSPSLCLVAAKRVYFGVGGGVAEFVRAVEKPGHDGTQGSVRVVWEHTEGVMKTVMRVDWDAGTDTSHVRSETLDKRP